MKTRNFGIFGVLLALVLLSQAGALKAQNNIVQSDTITYPFIDSINAGERLRDFGPLSHGQSECHTIYLQNSSADPLIIQTFTIQSNTGDFTITPIPTLPTVLLQNEIISIANLCYAPKDPTDSSEELILAISGTSGSTKFDHGFYVTGSQIVDPILQKPCVTVSIDSNLFGPIIMDGDVIHTVTIQSNRYDSLWVLNSDSLYLYADNKAFPITGITFPYRLAPLEVKTYTVTFSPRSNVPVVKYRYVGEVDLEVDTGKLWYYRQSCSYPNFILAGVAIPPTADSISTALAAGSTDILAMIGDNSVTTQTFHFSNTGTTNLKITGVSLLNNVSFAITNIAPSNTLPFTLTPGQSMAVTIAMTTVNNGVYYDEVIITAEQGIISMDFPLQGLRKNGVLGVNNTPVAGQHITLYPNPTHGYITVAIPGIRNAKIEVLDVLGKIITSASASEVWNWNSTAPAGTYVVHVSGTDASGKSFQSYDRFIIER